MFVAGVIACYGVIDTNVILIVGAMAVSPDLLPITAIGVGIVGRRPALAGRALVTLALGLAIASAAAAIFALAQDGLDLVPSGFNVNEAGVLGGLTTVNNETIAVALAAGVAGMLALETRASSGVGVAISVTTIPAAAYWSALSPRSHFRARSCGAQSRDGRRTAAEAARRFRDEHELIRQDGANARPHRSSPAAQSFSATRRLAVGRESVRKTGVRRRPRWAARL
jgi:uncharacterized hydrophobic protein (TIGR00271 family)